jgi:hypothetical protein
MSHHHHRQSYQKAFDHQVEYRVQDSKVPNSRYPFGHQLGQDVKKELLSLLIN